jgi:hypothetical protein
VTPLARHIEPIVPGLCAGHRLFDGPNEDMEGWDKPAMTRAKTK